MKFLNISRDEISSFIESRLNTNYILLTYPEFANRMGIDLDAVREEIKMLLKLKEEIKIAEI